MKTRNPKPLLILISVLLLASSACKKSTNTEVNCRLTEKLTSGMDTVLVNYDNQNRVISYGSLGYGLYTFNYTGALSATANTQIADTSYHISYNLALNNKGNVTYISKHYGYAGGYNNYTFTFQYDAEDHIVLCEQTVQGTGITGTQYYKDSSVYNGGNLTAKYTFAKSSYAASYLPTVRLEITYTNSPNKIGEHAYYYIEEPISIISGWDAFYHLFGNTSKNLPAVTKYYSNTGTLMYQWDYSFILNASGYPTEESIVRSIMNPASISRTFEYNCN